MADDTSSLSFLSRHPFWWFLIGPAGAVGSVLSMAKLMSPLVAR
jgi:hypothetical protein